MRTHGSQMQRRSYWRAGGGEPGLDHVLQRFLDLLAGCGAPHVQVERLVVENPARALAWLLRAAASLPPLAAASG
jgi:predicted metal-dependent phosphotriesterase family hydrolase